ncbi:MAG: hypothetical protein ACFE9L_12005 [Candidatus Hodarchaeota archaeon]
MGFDTMTICISGLCENGEKIIIASDKMVTVGSIIEFEHDVAKFVKLTNNCVILNAGSATIQDDIIKEALSKIKPLKKPNLNKITEIINEGYSKVRRKKAEELYLKPKGLDFRAFYQTQRSLLPEVVFQIMTLIDGTNLGVEYILCGFDEEGGHIHHITDPGTSECFDSVGFCAIGTGSVNAISVFTAYNYAPKFSLSESLYLVYLAKKEAERAPGVGNDTDMVIVSKEGIKDISSDDISALENIYNTRVQIKPEEYEDVKERIVEK